MYSGDASDELSVCSCAARRTVRENSMIERGGWDAWLMTVIRMKHVDFSREAPTPGIPGRTMLQSNRGD